MDETDPTIPEGRPLNAPERYDCKEAFRRIHDYVDRELTPEEIERVRAHLDVCAGCAREFRFEAQVVDDFRAHLRRVAVPADFKSSLLASLRARSREVGDTSSS